MLFARPGVENTAETLKIAVAAGKEKDLDIVVATSEGDTVLQLLDVAQAMNYSNRIVAVTHAYGVGTPGENELSAQVRMVLEEKGVKIVTAAHALSGAERGFSRTLGGIYPVEFVAATLRMFGQGVKVCVEISMMALDCGSISFGRPIIAVGGSSRGADTCCMLTPGYTAKILDTKIHAILCKPDLLAD